MTQFLCQNLLIVCIFVAIGDGAFAVTAPASSPTSSSSLSLLFVLQTDETCASGYAADDRSTAPIEQVCVAFDLTGLEATAFQAGVAMGEVGNNGKLRPFWPLVDIVFNTDPRPLPNPAVSPLIYFRFLSDTLCPSGYAGELLNLENSEKGCLLFDLDGFYGEAQQKLTYLDNESAAWDLSDIVFDVPAQEITTDANVR